MAGFMDVKGMFGLFVNDSMVVKGLFGLFEGFYGPFYGLFVNGFVG